MYVFLFAGLRTNLTPKFIGYRKQSLENLREIIIEAIEKTNKKNHTNTFVPPDEPIQNSPFLNPNDFMEHDNVTFTPEINENDTQNNEGW